MKRFVQILKSWFKFIFFNHKNVFGLEYDPFIDENLNGGLIDNKTFDILKLAFGLINMTLLCIYDIAKIDITNILNYTKLDNIKLSDDQRIYMFLFYGKYTMDGNIIRTFCISTDNCENNDIVAFICDDTNALVFIIKDFKDKLKNILKSGAIMQDVTEDLCSTPLIKLSIENLSYIANKITKYIKYYDIGL